MPKQITKAHEINKSTTVGDSYVAVGRKIPNSNKMITITIINKTRKQHT